MKEKFAQESEDGTPMGPEFKALAEFLQGSEELWTLIHIL